MELEINALRQRVAKLERTIEFLLAQLKLDYVDTPASTPHPEILDLVRKGKMMEAIRLYREKTGVGLAEAKQYVEGLNT